MKQPFILFAALLSLSTSAQLLAADCPAVQEMFDKDFDARLERADRADWLLDEFLATDSSKTSKDLSAERSVRKTGREREVDALRAELARLPKEEQNIPAGQYNPAEGTPGCEFLTRSIKTAHKQLDDREAELQKYFAGGYLFILGCDLVGTNLVKLSSSAGKPESKSDPQAMVKMAAFALEYPMQAAKLKSADFEKLAAEMFQPLDLSPRTRYSYAALRCLRTNQGVEIKRLADSSDALNMCVTLEWGELGKCVVEKTRLAPN
jgi:hypothetical protein